MKKDLRNLGHVLILAKDYASCRRFAGEFGLEEEGYTFIDRPTELTGNSQAIIVELDSHCWHPKFHTIQRAIPRGAVVIREQEIRQAFTNT